MNPESPKLRPEYPKGSTEGEPAGVLPESKKESTVEMVHAQLRELEQAVVADIRKRFTALPLSRDPSFLERLAAVAILTQALELQSQLLANEPLADDGSVVADIVDLEPIDPSLIPPDSEIQARLQAFVNVVEIDGEKYRGTISGEKYIKPELLTEPIIISDLGEMSLNRSITSAQYLELVDDTWKKGSDDYYTKTVVDTYGNTIDCIMIQMDPGVWVESMHVHAPLLFTEGDTARKFPIQIDFSALDPSLGQIDSGIYQPELLPLGSAGGIPVYVDNSTQMHLANAEGRQTILDQFTSEQDYIDSGVRFIYALYGSEPKFTGYVLSDSDEVNASANYSDDTITFNYALLQSTEKRWDTNTAIELVASHEAAHHTNNDHGIHTHPAVEVVFAKYGERLQRLNESVLFGESGGHAQDNTNELCASTMATLAHDRWEAVAQTLTSEDRTMYIDVLEAIEQAHLDAVSFKEPIPQGLADSFDMPDTLTGQEPIFRLLRDRIERLQKQIE